MNGIRGALSVSVRPNAAVRLHDRLLSVKRGKFRQRCNRTPGREGGAVEIAFFSGGLERRSAPTASGKALMALLEPGGLRGPRAALVPIALWEIGRPPQPLTISECLFKSPRLFLYSPGLSSFSRQTEQGAHV